MENTLTKAQIVERLLENKSITAAEAVILLQENQSQPHIPYINPFINSPYITDGEEMVPYGTYCSCNPANGGSGLCGCIMGNQLVPKRKSYYTTTTINTTGSGNLDNLPKAHYCSCNPKNGGSGSCGCK